MLRPQSSASEMQESSSHFGVESRAAARTNLFLAATLNSADGAHPVKVRDLSATGARIETSQVCEVGAAVTLVRGRLRVEARVSWRAERFCGLSFTPPVSIQAWMTNPVILDRQRAIPRAVEGGGSDAAPAVLKPGEGVGVAEELTRVASLLRTQCEALAADSGVVFNHGTQLYNIGLAARTLDALAETFRTDAGEAAASS